MTQFHLFGLVDHESDVCFNNECTLWGGTHHELSDINLADAPLGSSAEIALPFASLK